ncbi:CheR family methyltransferase [Halochromatium salexigens]|nr:CheR family methyltransferase [Halochromatium salexigens]
MTDRDGRSSSDALRPDCPEYLVALGASAGGLPHLRSIIGGLDRQGLSAYVLAQHLKPDQETRLPELLASQTDLEILLAESEMHLQPDHLYVCPAGQDMEVRDGQLVLRQPDPDVPEVPSIDRLFRSAADAFGDRACALILSGTGEDGAEGCQAVLAAGGQVIVQSPADARESQMPAAALRLSADARSGDTQEIVNWLNRISMLSDEELHEEPRGQGSKEGVFAELIKRVSELTGLKLDWYKEATLFRQTTRHYQALGFDSLEAYVDYAKDRPEQLKELQQRFLLAVSRFFRDPEAFATAEQALRPRLRDKDKGDAIRLWVAGCACGEEAYSFAILLHEILGERFDDFDVRIFASDADPQAIQAARAGLYPSESLSHLETDRRERWFIKQGGQWRVDKSLREHCVFCVHDLLRHPPFLNMDLISCRNLLIYFRSEQQPRCLETFHYALQPGGLFLTGRSESADSDAHFFEPIDALNKLYRRRAVPSQPPAQGRYALPVLADDPRRSQRRSQQTVDPIRDVVLDALIQMHGLAAVLVNTRFEPLHFFGNAKRYFSLPNDTSDFSLFALCRPELGLELKALCYRFLQEGRDVLHGISLELRVDDQRLRISPVARRLELSSELPAGAFLIVLEEQPVDESVSPSGQGQSDGSEDSQNVEIARLRRERDEIQDSLSALLDQLAAAHEELQWLREDKAVSTQELQTANEELQSSNEELSTLNDELRQKTHEATQLSTILTNIQESIRTALIVVDCDGRITRFNGLAVRIFGIGENDIGDHLAIMPSQIKLTDLRERLQAVISSGDSQAEPVHQDDLHYLMRIDPYRDELGEVAGAVLTFSDISELHRFELARASSERQFRQVWEATMEGMLVADERGTILLVNPALEQIFGYEAGELDGESVERLVPDALRARHQRHREDFQAAPEQRRPMDRSRDIQGQRKDGSRFDIAIGLSSIEMDGRRCTLASVEDITERKSAERELRASAQRLSEKEAELREAQRLARLGNWYWERATNRFSGSEELMRIFDHEPSAERSLPEPVWQRLKAAREETLGTGRGCTMDLEVAREGKDLWARVRCEAVLESDGHIKALRGTVQDISEHKRLTEELERHRSGLQELVEERTQSLAEQERRWAAIMRLLPVGVWITDATGTIVFGNEEGQRIWAGARYVGPDQFGVFKGWWHETGEPLAPEDWAVVRAIEQGESVLDELIDIQCFDESRKTILNAVIPLHDEAGRITGSFIVNQDVTALKQTEQALSQARDLAESSSQAKSEFLANMSHEIRTPMNAVLGFGYLLEQRSLDPASRQLVQKIRNSAQVLLDLINDILDVSKIEAGRIELEAAPFRLSVLLDSLAEIMIAAVGDKPLELVMVPPGDCIEGLIGDSKRLQQVLINLLCNAIKFTERGEVELSIVCKAQSETHVDLQFTVRDTGIGIAPKRQQEIFNAFSQADSSISRRFGGTGLGLTISQRLVRLMGGDLQVESALGQGSRFQFTLPLRRDPDETLPVDELGPLRLLVADDCRRVGEALMQTGQALGWTVDWVSSGRAASARLLAGAVSYDAILIDWQMPDEEGLECAQALRAALTETGEEAKSLILLMATPQADAALQGLPAQSAINGIIHKPVTPLSLYNSLASLRGLQPRGAKETTGILSPSQSEQLAGIRVLVVDDSEINQEVAERILSSHGAEVILAGDGEAALDWLDAHPDSTDIVLMDLQMPRLDGYAATRRLRQDVRWRELPVIAVTAGIFDSMKVRALEAGMNGFIGKPFDVGQLIQCVQRWTDLGVPVPTAKAEAAAAFPDTQRPADQGFDLPAALARWGDPGLYRTSLIKFRDMHANDAQTIAHAIDSGALAEGAALAHRLAGVAATLSMPQLADLAQCLEQRLRAGQAPDAATEDAFQRAFADVMAGLGDWIGSTEPEPTPVSTADHEGAVDVETRRQLFKGGLQAIDEHDLAGAEACLEQLQKIVEAKKLAAVQACLNEFDFRGAERLLHGLINEL